MLPSRRTLTAAMLLLWAGPSASWSAPAASAALRAGETRPAVAVRAEESAAALAAKLEAVEKDKDLQLRRLQQHRDEVARLRQLEMQLKQELDVVAASADTRRR